MVMWLNGDRSFGTVERKAEGLGPTAAAGDGSEERAGKDSARNREGMGERPAPYCKRTTRGWKRGKQAPSPACDAK